MVKAPSNYLTVAGRRCLLETIAVFVCKNIRNWMVIHLDKIVQSSFIDVGILDGLVAVLKLEEFSARTVLISYKA